MFQIEKSRNYAGYETDIHIKDIETQKELSITYGATWDLYWTLYTNYEMKKTQLEETFDIPKSEPELYSLLEELYQDVKNAKVANSLLENLPGFSSLSSLINISLV